MSKKNSEFLLPVYRKIGPVFVRGKGSYLWDNKGRKYLDFFPGWGVSILGHCHPAIVSSIHEQAGELIHLPNNLIHPWQNILAREIVRNSFESKVFFANSGAEAVETALKFSRLYGADKGRYEIISMRDSFHGRTFGCLSATGQRKYKRSFRPVLPSFKEAGFNDISDLKKKTTKKTVGIIIEVVQGEGGVNVADPDYIKELSKFCADNGFLLIIDEVQTGMGRTGRMFAYQNYGITPDIMVVSKGLGAGFPVSAMLVRKDLADIMGPGTHGSTFGGNPLATRVALEVFKVIKKEKITENAGKMGKYLRSLLCRMKDDFSVIKEVRGMGLMLGVELKIQSQDLFERAFKRKLIINSTHGNVLRIMPSLNVTKSEIDEAAEILRQVFKTYA